MPVKKRAKKVGKVIGRNKLSSAKARPIGVHIISLVFYASAVLGILLGLILAIGGPVFFNSASGSGSIAYISAQLGVSQSMLSSSSLSVLFISLGLAIILMSVIELLVGWGLWRCKQWARIVTIVLMIFGVVNSIGEIAHGRLFGGVIGLIISAGIAIYLSFSREVQNSFG